MIFFWVFGTQADLSSFQYRGTIVTASGRITWTDGTNLLENNKRIGAYSYEYVDRDGKARKGISYGKTRHRMYSKVVIESPAGKPELSRIKGMRAAPLSPWALLVAFFPLAGLVVVGIGIKDGIRIIHLFRNGRLTRATLKSIEKIRTLHKDIFEYKATFSFTADDGREYETAFKIDNTDNITDDSQELFLYDPKRPSAAVAVDTLPGSPTLDAASNLNLHSSLPDRTFVLMLIPILILLIHGVVAYKLYIK